MCLPSTVLSLWSQLSPTPTGCFPSCDLGVISCGTIAPDGVISRDEDTKTAAEVRNWRNSEYEIQYHIEYSSSMRLRLPNSWWRCTTNQRCLGDATDVKAVVISQQMFKHLRFRSKHVQSWKINNLYFLVIFWHFGSHLRFMQIRYH